MWTRKVYISRENKPYCIGFNVDFDGVKGQATSQARKRSMALRESYCAKKGPSKILEISSASDDENGTKLSALVLPVTINGKTVCVEQAFQSGKVFQKGGPFPELLDKDPKELKRIATENQKKFGDIIGFELDGVKYPTKPETAFYDWIYITALRQNKELADYLLQFDGFTDIQFNPKRSINCQAKSAAYYVALVKTGQIDNVKTFKDMVKILY